MERLALTHMKKKNKLEITFCCVLEMRFFFLLHQAVVCFDQKRREKQMKSSTPIVYLDSDRKRQQKHVGTSVKMETERNTWENPNAANAHLFAMMRHSADGFFFKKNSVDWSNRASAFLLTNILVRQTENATLVVQEEWKLMQQPRIKQCWRRW